MEYSKIRLAGIGRYLPDKRITNETIEANCQLPKGFCKEELGILERRQEEKLNQSQMGALAAKEALKEANMELFDVDLILNVSITFERKVPDNAPLIQRELGASELGIPSITIQSGINSIITAFEWAAKMMDSERYHCILIICSDITTQMLDESKPYASCLYADGAAAIVLLPDENEEGEVGRSYHLIKTGYADVLSSEYGMKMLTDINITPATVSYQFDYERYQEICIEMLKQILNKVLPSPKEEITAILQTAVKISTDALPKNLGVHHASMNYGICGTASILLTLYDLIRAGKLKEGEKLLMASVGDGMMASAMVMQYKK